MKVSYMWNIEVFSYMICRYVNNLQKLNLRAMIIDKTRVRLWTYITDCKFICAENNLIYYVKMIEIWVNKNIQWMCINHCSILCIWTLRYVITLWISLKSWIQHHGNLNRINPCIYYSFVFRVLQQNLIAFLMTPNKTA